MALRYEIDGELILLEDGRQPTEGAPLIEVLSEAEFRALGDEVNPSTRKAIASLLEAESCYVDVLPGKIIGSMAVPNKDDMMGDRRLFSFLWENDRLVFIDEGDIAEETMRRVANSDIDLTMTSALCLYAFLRELLIGDTVWLGDLEDKMEDAEEAMLDQTSDLATSDITAYRRITVRMSTYYEQVAAMALQLSANENRMMTTEEAQSFEKIMYMVDRLESRAETIREYSLTLRELHQTQIDIKQNNTMQLLTIVTVLIAPLTLIAGWFGMNFTNIPGVGEPWGYYVVTGAGIVITLCLIWWFHRKKWL